jgi:hypothetical protein
MKANVNKYENVLKLPAKAITVQEYATKTQQSVPNVYKQYRNGKLEGKIVVFKTMNFIIPN